MGERAVAKTDEWLTFGEVADALGVDRDTGNFKRTWVSLIGAAEDSNPTAVGSEPVRVAVRWHYNANRWCLHRDDVVVLAPVCGRRERRWPVRPQGWLTLDEAADQVKEGVDPDVMADAWRALTKGTTFEGGIQIAGLDIRLQRGHVYSNERWFIHPDGVRRLGEALRGRLPHLRKGFISPERLAAGVQEDARPLVLRLMTSLGDTKAHSGVAELDGDPVEIRRFLVDGEAKPCLAECERDRFIVAVTKLYEAEILGLSDGPRM